jgi:hypothetical protein
MFTSFPPTDLPDVKQYAIWLITIVVVAFGFRYARDIIGFIIDKLYQFFIQKNSI